jgi:hypothetical protein
MLLLDTEAEMLSRYQDDDSDESPYKAGTDYGRYEMCKYIRGHYEDMLRQYGKAE